MKHKFGIQAVTFTAYAAVLALFLLFFAYMYFFENNQVYSSRNISTYSTIEDYSVEEIKDSSAPVGIRKEYSFKIGGVDYDTGCLAFYLVHHYAEVRLGGELVYSLSPNENNLIGKSPSSNWVIIPIYTSDSGKEVKVTVTPVYKSVINRKIEFKTGSRYSIFMERFKHDLPQIILSVLCIFMGILIIGFQLYLIFKKKTSSWDMLFLGNFSILVGTWRITDTRFSPIMFSGNPMAIGYITLGALFIICIPLFLFVTDNYTGKGKIIFQIASLANCLFSFAALICQVSGIADLRETLKYCHIMLIIDLFVLLTVSIINCRKMLESRNLLILIILMVFGTLSDLLSFYINGSSSGIVFTVVAFLIYIIFRFIYNILNINRKAYIDAHTGLYNKRRWNELMENADNTSHPIGIIMFDLNRLKYTNDNLGHKTGDKMIRKFAEILRGNIPHNSFLCRWGGDEFTVMLNGSDCDKAESCISAVSSEVGFYNKSDGVPEIHFAAGYALSADYPGLSPKQLFEKADEAMYLDKQSWYEVNQLG